MLAKCVLVSPAAGHPLCWREILRLLKSRLQRWSEGDLAALWSEAVADGRTLSRHQSSSPPSLPPSLPPLNRPTTSGGQNWRYRTASTARPSRPSPLRAWPRPLQRSCRRCCASILTALPPPCPLVQCLLQLGSTSRSS